MSTQNTERGRPDKWEQERLDDPHQRWVRERWMELRTIQVGMTRGELLELWEPQGGMSHSTYQSLMSRRRCRSFLLDAQFDPYTGPDARDFTDGYDNRDVITHLSSITVGIAAMD